MGTRRPDHSTGGSSASLAVTDNSLTAQENIADGKAEFFAIESSMTLP